MAREPLAHIVDQTVAADWSAEAETIVGRERPGAGVRVPKLVARPQS
jgi:hypothetical protein